MTFCCCFDFEGRESSLRRLGEALGVEAAKGFTRLEQALTFSYFVFLFERLLLFKCGTRP